MRGATRVGARGPRACLEPRAPVPGRRRWERGGGCCGLQSSSSRGHPCPAPAPWPPRSPHSLCALLRSALPRCPLAGDRGLPSSWATAKSSEHGARELVCVRGRQLLVPAAARSALGCRESSSHLERPQSVACPCLSARKRQSVIPGRAREPGGAGWLDGVLALLARLIRTPLGSTWPCLCHALCACCCGSIFLPVAPAGLSLPCLPTRCPS